MKTYAVGDLHGMSHLLRQALEFIARDAGDEPARLVFLGDYIDRGPDPKGVLDILMAGPANPRHIWAPLKGNHDHLMEQALSRDVGGPGTWLMNGAETTIRSFGLDLVDWRDVPEPYLEFIRGLPLHFEDAQQIFVHAGLRPGIALKEQDPHDLVWIRDPFLTARYDFGKLVVHGHTPRPEVEYRP